MPKEIFQTGISYSNGERTIVFHSKLGSNMYFKENGKRDKLNCSTFYQLKFKPLEPISTGRITAKPTITREEYKRGHSLLYRVKE